MKLRLFVFLLLVPFALAAQERRIGLKTGVSFSNADLGSAPSCDARIGITGGVTYD